MEASLRGYWRTMGCLSGPCSSQTVVFKPLDCRTQLVCRFGGVMRDAVHPSLSAGFTASAYGVFLARSGTFFCQRCAAAGVSPGKLAPATSL
jgi:hypothetical protein